MCNWKTIHFLTTIRSHFRYKCRWSTSPSSCIWKTDSLRCSWKPKFRSILMGWDATGELSPFLKHIPWRCRLFERHANSIATDRSANLLHHEINCVNTCIIPNNCTYYIGIYKPPSLFQKPSVGSCRPHIQGRFLPWQRRSFALPGSHLGLSEGD